MAEPISAVLALVKNSWQAIEFCRSAVHATSEARHLWERVKDLSVFVKKIEETLLEHSEPFDKDIVAIVQKALSASNQTLDKLARRCLNIGDREDLALVHRITRPVYFTLSSRSIQKFEHELQIHMVSVQTAFYLLERKENSESTRRLASTLALLEQHMEMITQHISPTRQDMIEASDVTFSSAQDVDEWIRTSTSTLMSPMTASRSLEAHAIDDAETSSSPLEQLTSQETRAWGSVNQDVYVATTEKDSLQSDYKTAIVEAIKTHSLEASQHLLDDNAVLNGSDGQGLTPLMHTILEHGNSCDRCTEYMKELLRRGVNKNADCGGMTALHMAIRHDHFEAAKTLLQEGADVDASFPHTPLMFAVESNKSRFIELLLTYRSDVHVIDDANWGLVHHAVWHNSKEALDILLEKNKSMGLNLNLEAPCQMDWTPLMHLAEHAQRHSSIELALTLLDHGANVNTTDFCGYSALYYAVTRSAASPQRNTFVRFLIGRGADVEAVRKQVSQRIITRFPALKSSGMMAP
ncbi:hypothetical protein ACEQ8H_007443 [Pleosporales sp. CAS-2024a]